MANPATPRTRPLYALFFIIGLLMAMVPGVAHADTTVDWAGHGADSVTACSPDEDPYLHWVLTSGGSGAITSATLTINGQPQGSFHREGNSTSGAMHFYSDYFDITDPGFTASASYVFTGRVSNVKLVISDGCFPGVTAEKDAAADWTRAWDWDIEKSGDLDEATFEHDDTTPRTVTYTVKVSATSDDTFNVSGSVTVTNHPQADPAEIESILDDTFDLDCDTDLPTTLAPGDSITCTFDEDLEDKTDGTNTVTVTLEDDSTVTASADWEFGDTPDSEVDECIDVVDDNATPGDTSDDIPLGTVCESDLDENGEYTFDTYTATIDPTDERFLPCCNEVDLENIAEFTTNDTETTGSDNHVVVVHVLCAPDFDGCTPGFWKNETAANERAWAYLETEFGVTPDSPLFGTGHTVGEALDTEGDFDNLYFHGAAAYLNALLAEDGLIDYRYSVDEVEDIVMGTGIYTGMTAEERKDLLDLANNEGDCPFGARFP